MAVSLSGPAASTSWEKGKGNNRLGFYFKGGKKDEVKNSCM
jgi:hypothetical protein